jgi:hypothetical protein
MRMLQAVVVVIALASSVPLAESQVPGSVPVPSIQQPDLMASLLAEVRALRQELREAVRASARSQLLLGRLQLQQIQLARIDQQLALASARRLEATRERTAIAARLRELDRRTAEQGSGDERSAVEAERRQLRTQLQEQQSLEGQYRRQETELTDAISTEEQRLRDLAARLDATDLR